MTSIVAVLSESAGARACLDAAAVAAAVLGGQVEAFHARVKPESLILITEEVMTNERRGALVAMLDKKSQALQGTVREWAAAHATENPPAWNEIEGDTVEAIVAARGKTADLIVLSRPAEHEGKDALHAAIFETGRLLLLAPPSLEPSPPPFGRHMAIAWKTGDQAARAVTGSVPLLKRADRVSLLLVSEEDATASPDEAVALLDPHGIKAEPVLVDRGDASVGVRLLAEAHTIGADCLVMGAYRHNRLIELILGSVTRHMLQAADMPLFLMH